MDSDRITALLDAYGADPRRWPAAERARAEPCGTELLQGFEEARTIDDLLSLSPAVVPSRALRERVLASEPRARAVPRFGGSWFWRAAAGAGLAASLAAGVVVGWAAQGPAPADENLQLALAAYSAPASAFGDLELEEG